MTDFVDPTVISQINAAKDELVAEIAKISASSDVIDAYAGSLPDPLIPEAPLDGNTYGRKDKAWVNIGNSGGGSWGAITGTLSDQVDLKNALDDKADASSLADVATTGYYDDLLGKPSLIAEAPIDGTEYIRKDGVWANPAPVVLPANPNIKGNINMFPAAGGVNKDITLNIAQYTSSNNPMYIDAAGPFSGQFNWRVRFDNNGIAFSTDTSGTTFNYIGQTNLTGTKTATTVSIISDTGTDVTIPAADTSHAGVMTAADKAKLDGIEAGATAGGGGGSTPIRSLFVGRDKDCMDNEGNAFLWTPTQSVITNSQTDFSCDAIQSGFSAISPALQTVEWLLAPTSSDVSYLPTGAANGDDVLLRIMFTKGAYYSSAVIWCQFVDTGNPPNANNGNIYIRKMRGTGSPYDSGWKLISTPTQV